MNHLTELQAAVSAGGAFKYLLFWGHTPAQADMVDKSCLSQWFPAAFDVDGVRYATAEHFMMAQKARLFGDEAVFERVLAAEHPNEAKRLGREVKGFDTAHWEAARMDIVVRGNLAKFSQNAALRDFLCATAERVLVEASPVDRIWGIGLAADHAAASDPMRWEGLNLLGFALMAVRQMLRDD